MFNVFGKKLDLKSFHNKYTVLVHRRGFIIVTVQLCAKHVVTTKTDGVYIRNTTVRVICEFSFAVFNVYKW